MYMGRPEAHAGQRGVTRPNKTQKRKYKTQSRLHNKAAKVNETHDVTRVHLSPIREK